MLTDHGSCSNSYHDGTTSLPRRDKQLAQEPWFSFLLKMLILASSFFYNKRGLIKRSNLVVRYGYSPSSLRACISVAASPARSVNCCIASSRL